MAQTSYEKAVTYRDQILDRLIEVTASIAPDYNVDGQQVSKGQYLEQLQRSLDAANKTVQILETPYEIHTRGW